jgi:DNA-binding MarR family transcriptional regulator/GNAT superfamily N-acetyltransferase
MPVPRSDRPPTPSREALAHIAAVRRFNRFYTQRIGVLREGLVGTAFSLSEARVLYELAHRERPTAVELGRDLGLDAGYLSRILRGFARRGLIQRARSRADGRQVHLSITPRGRAAFAPLDARSRDEIDAILRPLTPPARTQLVGAMQSIERLLGGAARERAPYLLRPHQPGDMGMVVHLHGRLYAQEYGWDERFEALVATVAARFIERFDGRRERCWIAEKDGEVVGSVFVVQRSKSVAQLRLLIVDPRARGLGIGERLVDECVRFARAAGYRRITLWTQSILLAARRIYAAKGFRLARTERYAGFGTPLVSETWDLTL